MLARSVCTCFANTVQDYVLVAELVSYCYFLAVNKCAFCILPARCFPDLLMACQSWWLCLHYRAMST